MSQEQLSKPYDKDCKADGDHHVASETKNEIVGFVANNQTEPIGVQVVKQESGSQSEQQQRGDITIGEALEATALTAGHRPVDYSDAAAIQAAEVRATGRTNIVPGGVAAAAQSAATRNARLPRDEDKTKLGDILSDASAKLPSDKAVTRRDAEGSDRR
ncbi:hypothetical protein DH2020_023668 [Rehmannia glutinosa]|uniref:SMP domain-containing protein n=1 Tax=Rehmannia glutinosa TaxID=99300 RepID=A0ABR0WAW1_REHGL